MPDPQTKIPEEAEEAVMAEWVRCLNAPEGELYAERQGDEAREHLIARRMVEVAAPGIRKQERERFLGLLNKEIEIAEMVSHRGHVNVLKSFESAVLAALDTLEDPDG